MTVRPEELPQMLRAVAEEKSGDGKDLLLAMADFAHEAALLREDLKASLAKCQRLEAELRAYRAK